MPLHLFQWEIARQLLASLQGVLIRQRYRLCKPVRNYVVSGMPILRQVRALAQKKRRRLQQP